jgi:hypothetical protein
MNCTRLFIILYCSTLAVIFIFKHGDEAKYQRLMIGLVAPGKLFGRWRLPELSPFYFNVVGFCYFAALTSAALGVYSTISLLLGTICYFLDFSQIRTLSYVGRKSNLIPQFLVVMATVPAASESLWIPSAHWPLVILKLLVIQTYVSAGYSKLSNQGIRWASADQIQGILIRQHLYFDIPLSCKMASSRTLCAVLSVIVLCHQLTFPIVLILPSLEPLYVGLALLFHVTTLFSMKVDFLTYHAPSYLAFAVIPLGDYFFTLH